LVSLLLKRTNRIIIIRVYSSSFIGPALSGIIVSAIGFPAMLVITAMISFLYAPLMFFLKNPPAKEENLVDFFVSQQFI
jgi:uncharacterized membrane protein YoaK (UPF0700 family)